MKLYLLNDDKSIEREIELTPPKMVIGREVDTDIMLSVPGVSRYHCQLEFADNNWTLTDLGSTNGTKINKIKISEPKIMLPGDTLDVGEQLIRFGEASPTAATEIVESVKYNATDTVINQQTPEPVDHNKTEINIPVFDLTDTVKNVPIFDESATTTDAPQEAPKVIINLPGQSSGGGIVFEPFEGSPAETAESPVPPPSTPKPEETKKPEPAPMLTPEPSESMISPIPQTEPKKSKLDIEKKGQNESASSGKNNADDDDDDENYDANILRTVKLFGSQKNNGKKTQSNDSGSSQSKKSKRMSDMLFYVLVICSAVIIISLFVMFTRQPQKKQTTTQSNVSKRPSLVMVYEKKIISKDNVFRFAMALDGSQVEFMLDDLRSNRHFTKKDSNLSPELISSILRDIKSTGFMDLPEQTPGYPQGGIDERRTLKIGYDKKFKEVVVENNAVPNSFEDIEQSINTFAEEYGLHTISMTPTELKAQAEIAFNKAEELYKNREAKPGNLVDAIKRYKLTMELLDQFAPKPREWRLSRKRLSEANKILKKQISDLRFDFERYLKLKDFEKASMILKSLLPMLEPDTKPYKYYHKKQQALDNLLRRKRKK